MSRQLVESIIDKDFVLAESHFNDRLSAIMEKKLYEKKRMVATQMDEVMGGMSPEEARKKYRERGQTPRRASDVYGDPRDIKIKSSVKVKDAGQPKKRKVVPKAATKTAPKAAPKSTEKTTSGPEIQPDVEGRIRGGKSKEQPVVRNIAAKVIKFGRKFSNFRKTYLSTKKAATAAAAKKPSDDWSTNIAGDQPSHAKTTSYERPGRLQRNVNTLMGREPGHVDDRTPEEKMKTKGGRVGTVLRGAIQGAASGLTSSGI